MKGSVVDTHCRLGVGQVHFKVHDLFLITFQLLCLKFDQS